MLCLFEFGEKFSLDLMMTLPSFYQEAEKMLDIGGDKFPLESRKLLSSPGKNNSFR